MIVIFVIILLIFFNSWLGLRSHHVRNMLQCDPDTAVSLQPLSLRDNALITSLLNRPFMQVSLFFTIYLLSVLYSYILFLICFYCCGNW